ncbi:MAG TPA: hypothetical protein VM183_11065 [Burkholderiales bacterium]|nr:hypothetical protein [Burkholderiales bacterium]
MTNAREIDFNALPLSVRQRFVAAVNSSNAADAPLAREVQGVVALSIGLAMLVLLAWGGLSGLRDGFGQLGDPNAWQGWDEVANKGVWLAAAFYAALALWRRLRMRRAVPYAPGRYLFPVDLVDAQTRQLKIRPLANLKTIQPVHHYTQGIYRKTVLNLQFDDGTSESLVVRGKERAEQGIAQWQAKQAELQQAVQASDRAVLARLDPLFDVRAAKWNLDSPAATDGPLATGRVPAYLKWRAPIAIGAALVVALAALAVRNVLSDEAIYKEALRRGTERAYLDYVSAGWRHVDEIRAGLPRVALSDAKKKGSVTALRSVLQRYRGAGLDAEVAKEISVLYAAAMETFRAQAATADPTLVPFMERLLSVLRDAGGSTLQVRFTRPTIDALQTADARVVQRLGEPKAREFAPSASHFSSNSAAPREGRIVGEMNRGFKAIFPSDILTVAAAASPDSRLPVLDIAYTITPSGAIYKLDESSRLFVGVVAHFDVRMSLPAGSGDWRFQVEVQPPEKFTVNYQLPPGALKGVAPDERVYVVMAERAFDQLGLKLRTAFFKPDSDAYQRAAGKPAI